MLKTFLKQLTKYKIRGAKIKSPFKTAPYSFETIKEINSIILPLHDNKGRTFVTKLKSGDSIKKGQKIAVFPKNEDLFILSPVDGTINSISKDKIIIKPLSKEYSLSNTEYKKLDLNKFNSEEIINILKEKNVQGLGGALFPAYRKAQNKNIKHIILNGVECEPTNTCDKALIMSNIEEILAGGLILQKATNAQDVTIAVKVTQKDIIKNIKNAIANHSDFKDIKIEKIPNIYPAGYARQIIKFAFKVILQKSDRTSDSGFLVNNVATCFSIYRAIAFNEAQAERVISILGTDLNNPINILVPIGTSLKDIFKHANIDTKNIKTIRTKGLMMGEFLKQPLDFNTPITKDTAAIIINLEEPKESSDCINCGKCVQVCPLGLKPNKMVFTINNKDINHKDLDFIETCINCNLCNYLCPANINVTKKLAEAKKIKVEIENQEEHSEHISSLIEKKSKRLEKEKKEKEAKRKQRLNSRVKKEND